MLCVASCNTQGTVRVLKLLPWLIRHFVMEECRLAEDFSLLSRFCHASNRRAKVVRLPGPVCIRRQPRVRVTVSDSPIRRSNLQTPANRHHKNTHSEVLSKMYDSDDFEEPHVPLLSFEEWRRNYRPHPKPTPTSASSQSSKRSGRRQLDPYEQLSLVNLARQQDMNLHYGYDQKALDIAVAHDFEEKHGWRLKSVRSELLDLERKWRAGTGHGFSTHLSEAIRRWSNEMDLNRARKAEEMA